MGQMQPHSDQAYVIVAAWPKNADEEKCCAGLMRACAIELPAAREVCRHGTPAVVRRIVSAQAPIAAANLAKLGFGSAWLPHDEMAKRVAAKPVKCLLPALGAPKAMYFAELWREKEGLGVLAEDIIMLTRGRTRHFTTTSHGPNSGAAMLSAPMVPVLNMPQADNSSAGVTKSAKYIELLDVHLNNGITLRCDGTRFRFDMLGDQKGYSDNENTDLLTAALGREAAHAVIDTYFPARRPPMELVVDFRATASGSGELRTPEAFSVYSAWAACMCQRGITW